jgi:hypothetical protein
LRTYFKAWMILVAVGLMFMTAAIIVARWECPSESSDFVRFMWVASGLSGVAVLSIGAGLALWLWRTP